MDISTGGPTKPEKTDGYEEAAHACWWQSCLGLHLALLVKLWLQALVKIPEKRRDGDKSTDKNAEVCQSFLSKVEVINLDEDDFLKLH